VNRSPNSSLFVSGPVYVVLLVHHEHHNMSVIPRYFISFIASSSFIFLDLGVASRMLYVLVG